MKKCSQTQDFFFLPDFVLALIPQYHKRFLRPNQVRLDRSNQAHYCKMNLHHQNLHRLHFPRGNKFRICPTDFDDLKLTRIWCRYQYTAKVHSCYPHTLESISLLILLANNHRRFCQRKWMVDFL